MNLIIMLQVTVGFSLIALGVVMAVHHSLIIYGAIFASVGILVLAISGTIGRITAGRLLLVGLLWLLAGAAVVGGCLIIYTTNNIALAVIAVLGALLAINSAVPLAIAITTSD